MAINTMGAPNFAPVRQESQVIRTQAEYDAMRAAAEKKAMEQARAARKAAQAASGYDEYANRYRNAPSVAELMQATGANAQEATRIREYQDWNNYTPSGGWGQQDIETIQGQLADPNRVSPEFQYKFSEPGTAGSIMPYYKDNGQGNFQQASWIMNAGSGDNGTVLGSGYDKDRFYQEAMGRGVGTAGRDKFAQDMGAKDWNSLNWDGDVKQYDKAFAGGEWGKGAYQGYGDTYQQDPTKWGGNSYGVRGTGVEPYMVSKDGTSTPFRDMAGSPWALQSAQQRYFDANNITGLARQNNAAMNADFAKTMGDRQGNEIRNQQAYASLLGNNQPGGLFGQNYSDANFGQITGREAQQSPFTMSQQGPYPWSPSPTQQLDVSSLLTPSYGGPGGGSGSMGSYGGKTGGLGGLGGSQMGSSPWGGPIGARNPWSPS